MVESMVVTLLVHFVVVDDLLYYDILRQKSYDPPWCMLYLSMYIYIYIYCESELNVYVCMEEVASKYNYYICLLAV